ncbi:MAG TPA: TetR/AcrR family transcriptional regulator [Vicinamibacterales bacterium]|jgi:TetR/AcrR family fatty acid metabolism transcriptional regulator
MPRTKKDVVTEFRTAAILQAAGHVFAERGFDQATIAAIAEAAGVGKGTVYLYYRSKREVYWAALSRSFLELHAETRRAVDAAQGVEDKVRAFIDTKVRYFEAHRDFFRIYFSEFGRSVARHAQFQRQMDDLFLEQVRTLEAVLQQGVRHKVVRPLRLDAAAFGVFDITRGVITQRLRGWSRASVDDDIAFAFDFAWKGLGQR